MEQYQTKNKMFNSIITPIVIYLENANFDVESRVLFITLESTIHDLLRRFIDKDTQGYVDKFLSLQKQIKNTKKPSESDWRKFIDVLFNLLLKLDEIKMNVINKCLNDSQDHLESFKNTNERKYLNDWFKKLCIMIGSTIKILQNRCAEIVSNAVSDSLLLRIMQLVTCTRLIMEIARLEIGNIVIKESRRFLIKRFIHCFNDIKRILTDDIPDESTPGFIQWMDNALDYVSAIEPNENIVKSIENAKRAMDEVLCHAMSLAQISSADDSKIIKASVQTVLFEFGQLQTESKNTIVNPALCHLYIDIVSDKLCMLERRVNTAVLIMFLRVFSESFVPLRKLRDFCEETNTSILKRSEEDLDDLISIFDGHVDCIMQVGLFAIACSTNTTIIVQIRDCLASLESLESELVPAITTLYMEPSKESDLHAKFLVDCWRSEVQILKKNVCFIIDPVAFGQVVFDSYKSVVMDLKVQLAKDDTVFTRDDIFYPVCKRMDLYKSVAFASIKDLKIAEDSAVYKHYTNFTTIFAEVSVAIDNLLIYTHREYSERIFKRIKILETMLKRLLLVFTEYEDNKPKTDEQEINQSQLSKLDLQKNQVDIDIEDFENRAQEILKNRSVLYKTPLKNKKLLSVATPKSQSKFSKSQRIGISFIRRTVLPNSTEELEHTLNLQLTQILESLSSTASKLHVPHSISTSYKS